MKICFLAPGSSIHTVKWLNAFSELGHEVSLITMHNKLKNNQLNNTVKVYELPIKNKMGYFLNFLEVRKILRKIEPDLLNVHYASGYGTLSRLANFHPNLLSVWGSDVYIYPYQSRFNYKTVRNNLSYADAIASTSNAMANQIKLIYPTNKKIKITPFGINTSLFIPSNKSLVTERITIGTVKSLEYVYGIDTLIESFNLLLNKLIESNHIYSNKTYLKIVGDGTEMKKMKQLAINLGISDKVEFIGKVSNSEVPNYLNEIDIYCALSRSESFGVAVLEASSCEVPVVVSNVGGLPEVVIDNETGYIVNTENEDEIVEKLFELICNKEKRIKMGKKGREFVRENYKWSKNVSHMEQIYESLIEENKNKQELK